MASRATKAGSRSTTSWRRRTPCSPRRTPATGTRLRRTGSRSIPHQAVFYNWFLRTAGFGERSIDVVGTGIGGWIAAQMAIMSDTPLRRLVLVDAAGLRPDARRDPRHLRHPVAGGDRTRLPAIRRASSEYQRLYGAPLPEYGGVREAGRTMSMRMCYRPYMYDPSLAGDAGQDRHAHARGLGAQDADRSARVRAKQFQQRDSQRTRCACWSSCGHFRPPRTAASARAHDRRLLFWRRPMTRYYYFSEQPYTAYDPPRAGRVPVAATDAARTRCSIPGRGSRPLQPLSRRISGGRRIRARLRRHHDQRAPHGAVLHAGVDHDHGRRAGQRSRATCRS